MGCYKNLVTAEAKTKAWLRDKGAIDKYRNITNLSLFNRLNKRIREEAKTKYGIDTEWFYINDVFGDRGVAIPNSQAFKEVDKKNGIFYNLNEADLKRKKKLPDLNAFIRETVGKIRKAVSTGGTSSITIESIEQYNKRHYKLYGKKVSQLGIANLMEGIIAYAEKDGDGVTLSEEAFHFLVELMWDEPSMLAIRNLKDSSGRQLFKETDIWRNNSDKYLGIYNDPVAVEKEVMAKLLSQYIYDKYARQTFAQKIARAIENFLKFLRIRINLALDLNLLDYNADLKLAMDEYIADIENTPSFVLDNSKYSEPVTLRESKHRVELQKAVDAITKQKKMIEAAVSGLTGKLSQELQEFIDANPLYKDTTEALKRINFLKEKSETTPLTPFEEDELSEIIKMYKLMMSKGRDRYNLKLLDRLHTRLKKLRADYNSQLFILGINSFFFGASNDELAAPDDPLNTDGVFFEIESMASIIPKINDGTVEMDTEMFSRIYETIKLYEPIMDLVASIYQNGDTLDDLTPTQNARLKEGLRQSMETIAALKRLLKLQVGKVRRNQLLKETNLNPDLDLDTNDYLFSEVSRVFRYFGNFSHVSEDWLKIFQKKLMELDHLVKKNATNYFNDLYAEIEADLKKIGRSGIRQMYETDERGRSTGYFTNSRLTYLYVRNKEEFEKQLMKDIEVWAKGKFGKNYYVPTDKYKLLDWFEASHLRNIDATILDLEMARRAEIRDYYNKQWSKWRKKNIMWHPNKDAIMKQRQEELTAVQYDKWLRNNIITVVLADGTIIEYPAGELAIPSDGKHGTVNYLNPKFEEIKKHNPALYRALTKLTRSVVQDRARINRGKYEYEYKYLLPQVSQSFLDTAYRGFKGFGEEIVEGTLQRPDDDRYAARIEGSIVKRPPIRFDTPLDNPNLITKDIVRAVQMYNEMAENFMVKARALPELQGMIDLVSVGKVTKKKYDLFGTKMEAEGQGTELEENLKFLMRRFVFGEHKSSYNFLNFTLPDGRILDANKILDSFAKYLRDLNLLGGVTSYLAGLGTATIDNMIEAKIGKYNSIEDWGNAKIEFARNLMQITMDYESPKKTHKITILASELNLVDSTKDRFSNTDKARLIRSTDKMIGYSGWRGMDVTSKYQIMISTAMGIREIDGKWYTASQWKGDKTTWKNALRLYDQIQVVDGKIDWTNIPESVIDLYKNRTKGISSYIDTLPLAYDTGLGQWDVFLKFFTMHMGWLFQSAARGFKARSFNYITQEMEEGYYRVGFRLIAPWNIVDTLRHWHSMDALEKESVIRVISQMGATAVLWAISYILVSLSLDDEDKESSGMQFAAHLLQRLTMEQSARLSPAETLEYVVRPTANVDKITHIFDIATVILDFFKGGQEIESGFYEGYTKRQQAAIKSLPLVRGLFENIGGGFVNELTGKGATKIGVSHAGKAGYIRSNVINKEGDLDFLWDLPGALLPKAIGGTLAKRIADHLSYYPDNSSSININYPTKKANE